jgi:acyl carrier protein
VTAIDDITSRLTSLLVTYIKENVADKTDTDIGPDTDLTGDLELESIQIMEYVVEIEDDYDISIDLESLSNAKTISDLAGVVARELN